MISDEAVEESGCNCGCGKGRGAVIREIMRTEGLNEDQAEDRLNRANLYRSQL